MMQHLETEPNIKIKKTPTRLIQNEIPIENANQTSIP